ncbi:hypothetical protein Trydic_g10230 [Trypoxylus dichotomus]
MNIKFQVIRHGHKTRDRMTIYPTDPYKSYTFLPYGEGMLRNDGKTAAYETGKAFRKRYDNFLGGYYYSDLIEAWSTEFERCRATAELVLTGMFPPKGEQKWNEELQWQPVSVQYRLIDDDQMMIAVARHPVYMKMYNKNFEDGYGKELLEKYANTLGYIEKHTGQKITSTRQPYLLRDNLTCVKELGLELPAWSEKIYPSQTLDDMVYEEYNMQCYHRGLRRIVSGQLLKKILTDSVEKVKGNSKKKMHLYACHDVNITGLLINLGAMYPHVPAYVATVVLELHKFGDRHGFKLFYKKSTESNFEMMTFEGDKEVLWLEEYENIVNDIWTDDETTEHF